MNMSTIEMQALKLRWVIDFVDSPTSEAKAAQALFANLLGTLTANIKVGNDIEIGGNKDIFGVANECPKCNSRFIVYDELEEEKVCLCCGLREHGYIGYDRFLELHVLRWAIRNRPGKEYTPPRNTDILPAWAIRQIAKW